MTLLICIFIFIEVFFSGLLALRLNKIKKVLSFGKSYAASVFKEMILGALGAQVTSILTLIGLLFLARYTEPIDFSVQIYYGMVILISLILLLDLYIKRIFAKKIDQIINILTRNEYETRK